MIAIYQWVALPNGDTKLVSVFPWLFADDGAYNYLAQIATLWNGKRTRNDCQLAAVRTQKPIGYFWPAQHGGSTSPAPPPLPPPPPPPMPTPDPYKGPPVLPPPLPPPGVEGIGVPHHHHGGGHHHHYGGGFRGYRPDVVIVETGTQACEVWSVPVVRDASTAALFARAEAVTSPGVPQFVEWPYLYSREGGGVVVRRCLG